ncbi:MAG: GlmU family protein [Candidatus Cyclobacteriaceae bacterium M2_1C_046]
MNLILFDQKEIKAALLPLTFTRPVGNLRVGILTIAEKWEKHFEKEASYFTEHYLSDKYPLRSTDDNIMINGAICPDEPLVEKIKALDTHESLVKGNIIIAGRGGESQIPDSGYINKEYDGKITLIDRPWKIFKSNAAEIKKDFKLITKGRKSAEITDPHTIIYNKENVFVEEGAVIRAAVLNADPGPIYIGKNARVEEGAIIRGSFALCEGSYVNIGAKMRGDSTIGPYSKVGGEVSNSVIQGYSNKGHDGFIGNSVIGEWCNLGADTNTSNLKNNYADVRLWDYSSGRFANTGETFCGLIMGDHSKCGINTMFNTGTVVGVSANIFGAGFPRNFIPSFAWGGSGGFTTYEMSKVYEVAEIVMARRQKEFNEQEKAILQHIFDATAQYRYWEK